MPPVSNVFHSFAAGAEPFVFLSGRPAAERAADARGGCDFTGFLSSSSSRSRTTARNGKLIRGTVSFRLSPHSSRLTDFGRKHHAHWIVPSSPRELRFFPITRTSFPRRPRILDRHAEARVFVLLVIGGKGILVEQDQFGVIRAPLAESREASF